MNNSKNTIAGATVPVAYPMLVWGSLFLVLAGCIIGIMVPAGLGWDFANFYDAGRMIAAGEQHNLLKSEKVLIGGQPPQGIIDFWGTPISAWLYVPLAGFTPETALILFKLQNVLAYAAALLLLYFHARRFVPADDLSRWRFTALYALLVLLYQPFWTVFRVGGQTTATVLLLLCGALILHGRLRYAWSSGLFVVAVMIKPSLATGLFFLMLVTTPVFLFYSLLWLMLAGVLSVAVMGWDLQMEFVAKMLSGGGFTGGWANSSSIYSAFGALELLQEPGQLQADSRVFSIIVLLTKAAVVATFIYLVRRMRSRLAGLQERAHFAFLLAILFFLLFSQTLWEHYLSFLFIPLACLLAVPQCFERLHGWLLGLLIAVIPLQNLIVVRLLQSRFDLDTLTGLLPVLIIKTIPLWLSWYMLLKYNDNIMCLYRRGMQGAR